MHTFHLAGPTRDRSEFRGTAWAGDEIRGGTRCQVNRWRCAPTDVEFLRIAYSSALRRCAAHHRSHCVGCAGGRWDTGACGRWSGRTRGYAAAQVREAARAGGSPGGKTAAQRRARHSPRQQTGKPQSIRGSASRSPGVVKTINLFGRTLLLGPSERHLLGLY